MNSKLNRQTAPIQKQQTVSALKSSGGLVQSQHSASLASNAVPPIVHDVLRSPGQPLDANTRAFMEPRFGHDFSKVRVHMDQRAAESAQAVNALAYTVGRDVVFGNGQYAPATGEGRKLMAHELTHVVQQYSAQEAEIAIGPAKDVYEKQAISAGTRVGIKNGPLDAIVSRASLSRKQIQRQVTSEKAPLKVVPTTETKVPNLNSKEEAQKKEDETAAIIISTLKPGVTALDFKQYWPLIEKQIKSPVQLKSASKLMKQKYSGLFDGNLVEKLSKLSPQARAAISDRVYNELITTLTGIGAEDLVKEFTKLDNFVQRNIEAGIRGYVSTRAALLATFGSIAKINQYYKSLVPAGFPSPDSKVNGHNTYVHPKLGERLTRASTALKQRKVGTKTWFDITEEGIKGIGGFNIRENRNNPKSLSNHSFGWAIDIDAALNPNVKSFPNDLVVGLTGRDMYKGDETEKIKTGGTVDELVREARSMRGASDLFMQTFETEDSLKASFVGYLKTKSHSLAEGQASELINLLKKNSKKKLLEKWLSELNNPNPKSSLPTSTTSTKSDTKTAANTQETSKIADLLIQAYKVFKGTRNKKEEKIPPSTVGTAQSIAAHGFLNLPAELIAALTGTDGGGLKWLGAIEKGTKDFMHFELKKADIPTLARDENQLGDFPMPKDSEVLA